MVWIASHAGLIGLLFFFFVFLGIGVWLFRPGMKSRLEPLGSIPLNEDNYDRS